MDKNKTEEKKENVSANTDEKNEVVNTDSHEVAASTITMQGVSGKKITGSVVVVKKAKPKAVVQKQPDNNENENKDSKSVKVVDKSKEETSKETKTQEKDVKSIENETISDLPDAINEVSAKEKDKPGDDKSGNDKKVIEKEDTVKEKTENEKAEGEKPVKPSDIEIEKIPEKKDPAEQKKEKAPFAGKAERERASRDSSRAPYQDNRGQRPPYQDNRGTGGAPSQDNRGQRPPYQNNRGTGGAPSQDNRGQRPSYQDNRGARPPYQDNRGPGGAPSQDNRGQRPPYNAARAASQGRDAARSGQSSGGPGGRDQSTQSRGPGYQQNDRFRPSTGAPRFDKRPAEEKDVVEKIPEAPKTNFAQRNAYEKEKQNIEKTSVKKDNTKNLGFKDKHNSLKKQTAVLSTTDASNVLKDETLLDSMFSSDGKRKSRNRNNKRRDRNVRSNTPMVRAVLTNVTLPETLTVKELAEAIKKTSAEVIKKLINYGIMATVNQELDYDTAAVIVEEFGIKPTKAIVVTEEDILFDDTEDKAEDLIPRPPVVVVMGHVDHGKTSLLDKIRSASVVTGEAGGITQHIGAYMVKLKDRNITFLDTPGHEAFTTMRARGAQVTDIAILVVAADDGVMPQTVEAINHAKSAGVQIIVAINKMDKPGANPDRVKQELSEYGIIPEEWGGENIMVPVSAITGDSIDELLEMILLTADLMDLKSNPAKQAKGTVIEAKLDKNRGPVATVLVQRGTLKSGDTMVTGSIIGRVRAMTDDSGAMVKTAGPSVPVEVLGLPEVPEAGEIFYAVEDEKIARSLADKRRIKQREQQLKSSSKMSLDNLFAQMEAGEIKDLNLIVKADVQGSVEAVKQSLEKLNTEKGEVRVKVIHGAVGTLTESDVRLAEVSNAIIIGFNVRPPANVAEMAVNLGVDIRLYRIIYQAIEEIEAAMKGMLSKQYKEVVLGHVEIRQVFKVSGVGTIGGAYVTDGKIMRSCDVRLLRDGVVIHEGKLASLKRFKDDAKEVASGYECGISLEKYNDIKEGDVIEAFEMQEIAQV